MLEDLVHIYVIKLPHSGANPGFSEGESESVVDLEGWG